MKHHIWCNYYNLDPKECKVCTRLKEQYPEKDKTPDELLHQYFSEVINNFERKMLENIEDLPSEFSETIDKYFWELV